MLELEAGSVAIVDAMMDGWIGSCYICALPCVSKTTTMDGFRSKMEDARERLLRVRLESDKITRGIDWRQRLVLWCSSGRQVRLSDHFQLG